MCHVAFQQEVCTRAREGILEKPSTSSRSVKPSLPLVRLMFVVLPPYLPLSAMGQGARRRSTCLSFHADVPEGVGRTGDEQDVATAQGSGFERDHQEGYLHKRRVAGPATLVGGEMMRWTLRKSMGHDSSSSKHPFVTVVETVAVGVSATAQIRSWGRPL